MKWQFEAVNDGNVCPHCGELDTQMQYERPDFCDDAVYITQQCGDCNKKWQQTYKLVKVESCK